VAILQSEQSNNTIKIYQYNELISPKLFVKQFTISVVKQFAKSVVIQFIKSFTKTFSKSIGKPSIKSKSKSKVKQNTNHNQTQTKVLYYTSGNFLPKVLLFRDRHETIHTP